MDNIITVNQAKEKLATILTTPLPRKELLERCVKTQNLTQQELKDNTPGKILNIIKCRFGDAIEQLIKNGTIIKNNNEELEFHKKTDIQVEIASDIKIQDKIIELLTNKSLRKKELFSEICSAFSTSLSIKENILKSKSGIIIKNLLDNNEIICKEGVYSLYNSKDSNNEILFYNLSDESLVEYTLQMLKIFLENSKFYRIENYQNTDGPKDGGIDGIINATDKLGFKEKFIIQVKNCQNKEKFVPLSEVREFYGVFSVDNEASKAIFVTKGKYHSDTIKFVDKIKDNRYLLIDGKKWLQLAKTCNFIISENR